jgi:hypothetical protein
MIKNRFLTIAFSLLILGILYPPPCTLGVHASLESLDSLANVPDIQTPQELKNVWLRFHKDNLCQKLDAVFVFEENRLRVFLNIENPGQEKELLKRLEPLQNSFLIDLVPVRVTAQKSPSDIPSTPPSFWVNSRLVERIHDSLMLDAPIFTHGLLSRPTNLPESLRMQQRMLEYSRTTFEYTLKVKRLAAHLPILARAAYDPDAPADFRKQALEVCRKHARDLEKYAKRLSSNLDDALPEPSSEFKITATTGTDSTPVDEAAHLSSEAQNTSTLIYNFMYSKNFTVDLSDLRNPPLIRSMKKLLQITEEFRNSIS